MSNSNPKRTISQMKKSAKAPRKWTKSAQTMLVFDMRSAREAANLSVRDVAMASGASAATVARCEWGAMPDLASALRLANFYEKDVSGIWRLK